MASCLSVSIKQSGAYFLKSAVFLRVNFLEP